MAEDGYRDYREAAERIAREAGDLLREHYGRVEASEKAPGDLVTAADLASQRRIAEALADAFPDHTLLAEEEGVRPDPGRPWRWIVDPLDGTMNFAHGYPFWTVSIGLEHAGELVVGVVYDPLGDAMYSASKGAGATLDGRPIRVSGTDRLSRSLIAAAMPVDFAADASRQLALMGRFSTGTHSVRRSGSTAYNLALVAAGRSEVAYGTHVNPWDVAAGVVLVREAGGVVSALDGGPYDVYGPELLATNGAVHEEVVEAVRGAIGG